MYFYYGDFFSSFLFHKHHTTFVPENNWDGHIFYNCGWCPGRLSFPFVQFKAPGPGKFFEFQTTWNNCKMSWNLFLGNIFMKEWPVLRLIRDQTGLYQWFENYTHIQNVLCESLISVLVTIFQFWVLRFGNRTGCSSRKLFFICLHLQMWVRQTKCSDKKRE